MVVKIHNSVIQLNEQLKKGAKRYNFLTPRDFLDFIKHINALHKEKKQILEEQQYHLNSGLSKLKELEQTVKEMDASLQTYKDQLDINEKQSNEKMELIVKEQQEAEEREEFVKELTAKLKVQKKQIAERTVVVQKDLDKAGPALEKAKSAVENITSKEINNLRVLGKPPMPIRMTLEAVTMLLNGKSNEWRAIQKMMKGKNFISSIMQMNIDNVKKKIKDKVNKQYLQSPDWDIKRIYKAYKAAGILAEWLQSQLSYSIILNSVDPLRKEIK